MPLPLALNPPIANTARLRDAILSLQPTAYWPLDDGSGALRDLTGRYPASVTAGSPTRRVAAPPPIDMGMTWSGTSQYANSATLPNMTTGLSVFCLFRTTAVGPHYLMGRGNTADFSWDLRVTATTNVLSMIPSQAAGTAYDTAASVEAVNDGIWHSVMAGVDGADGLAFLGLDNKAMVKPGGVAGTWNVTSAVAFGIASRGPSANPFNGTLAHVAIWNDRFPGDAARMWLSSIALGG